LQRKKLLALGRLGAPLPLSVLGWS